jgi:hypothetical protein
MPTLYIRGKKYSGSTWYNINLATKLENNANSIPNSAVTYELKEAIDEKIQSYSTFSDFPSKGITNTLYMDLATNKTYRWNNDDSVYTQVGTDYNDIDVINGGF